MSSLTAFLDRLSSRRKLTVVTVGDVMLDVYISGAVKRISPEAPVPVLSFENESRMLGGAGNVHQNLIALGAHALLLAVLKEDDSGQQFRQLATALPGGAFHAIPDPHRTTAIKTRLMTQGKHLLRVDTETPAPLAADTAAALIKQARLALTEARALVISDYKKGVVTDGVLQEILSAAENRNIISLVDPKGTDYKRYRQATLLTPNLLELAQATGQTRLANTDDAVTAAARALLARDGLQALLVTRGSRGISFFRKNTVLHFPVARPRPVHDVAGAGDSVIAAVALGLAAGKTGSAPVATCLDDCDRIREICHFANTVAGLVVAKPGTATVSLEELRNAVTRHNGTLHDKCLPMDAARTKVAAWRRAGCRIGLTNGCFDLLHRGHLSLLAMAKRNCDKLVVLVNSDASVARLKGRNRPVMPLDDRMLLLSSMADVDAVVAFAQDTPYEAIRILQPDILVKGADYQESDIAGSDIVIKRNGAVLRCPLEEGLSTTKLIASIVKRQR